MSRLAIHLHALRGTRGLVPGDGMDPLHDGIGPGVDGPTPGNWLSAHGDDGARALGEEPVKGRIGTFGRRSTALIDRVAFSTEYPDA